MLWHDSINGRRHNASCWIALLIGGIYICPVLGDGVADDTAIHNNHTVFLLWMLTTTPLYMLGGFAMLYRQNYQPVKARDPFLLAVMNFGFFITTSLRCFLLVVSDLPCIIDVLETSVSMGMITGVYLLRSWKMYFKFELAHERSLLREDTSDVKSSNIVSTTHDAWYSRHRFLISQSFTIAFTSVLLIWFLAPVLAVSASGSMRGVLVGSKECLSPPPLFSSFVTISGVSLLFLILILSTKLRRAFDAFGIKKELIRVTYIIMASWIIVIVVISFKERLSEHVLSIRKLIPLAFYLPMFWTSTIEPVYQSYVQQSSFQHRVHAKGDEFDITSLAGVLNNTAAFKKFENYLVGCFCVESILFWRDIEAFYTMFSSSIVYASHQNKKSLPNIADIVDRANDIADTYIYENSTMQVNISSTLRQKCQLELEVINNKYLNPTTRGHSRAASGFSALLNDSKVISLSVQKTEGGKVQSAGRVSLSRKSEHCGEICDNFAANSAKDIHRKSLSSMAYEAIAGQSTTENRNQEVLAQKYMDIATLFEAVHFEVFELMRTDVFPRFVSTNAFKQLMESAKTQNAAQKELAELHIL